jgi:putative ABC transport system permease protein
MTARFSVPEQPETAQDPALVAQVNQADPYTFEALGIPLLRGRVITEQDREGAPLAAVVNRRLAERFWPDQDPIGRQLLIVGPEPAQATIVGVVGDIRHHALDEPDRFQIYGAQAQNPHIFNTLAVRTEGDPLLLARAVSEAVWSVDADQPVWKVRTMQSLIDRSFSLRRFMVQLMGAYSVLALLLAAVGIYGVMGYTVARRRRELGLRMALGADRGSIFRLIVGQGMRLVALGVALGLAGALALARTLESLLYGVPPHDPLTFTLVAGLLAAVALAACALPARRATRADPLEALRCE